MDTVVKFARPVPKLPPRDPDAPRVPNQYPTAKQFQLSDDGEGLPLPYDPRNLESKR